MLSGTSIVIIPSVGIFIIALGMLLATIVGVVVFSLYMSSHKAEYKHRMDAELVRISKENRRLQDVLVHTPTEIEVKPPQGRKRTAAPELVSDSAASRIVHKPQRLALVPLPHRAIKRVVFDKQQEYVQSFDENGHLIPEYCGKFEQVGHKILVVYSGRWIQQEVSGEVRVLHPNRDTPIPPTLQDVPEHSTHFHA